MFEDSNTEEGEVKKLEEDEDSETFSYSYPFYSRFTFTGKTKSRLGKNRSTRLTLNKGETKGNEVGNINPGSTDLGCTQGSINQAPKTPSWLRGDGLATSNPFTPGTSLFRPSKNVTDSHASVNDSGIDVSSQSNFLFTLKNDSAQSSNCRRNLTFSQTPFKTGESRNSLKELNQLLQAPSFPKLDFSSDSKEENKENSENHRKTQHVNNKDGSSFDPSWNKLKEICDAAIPDVPVVTRAQEVSRLPNLGDRNHFGLPKDEPFRPSSFAPSSFFHSASGQKTDDDVSNTPLDLSSGENLTNNSIFSRSISSKSDQTTGGTQICVAESEAQTHDQVKDETDIDSTKQSNSTNCINSILPKFLVPTNKVKSRELNNDGLLIESPSTVINTGKTVFDFSKPTSVQDVTPKPFALYPVKHLGGVESSSEIKQNSGFLTHENSDGNLVNKGDLVSYSKHPPQNILSKAVVSDSASTALSAFKHLSLHTTENSSDSQIPVARNCQQSLKHPEQIMIESKKLMQNCELKSLPSHPVEHNGALKNSSSCVAIKPHYQASSGNILSKVNPKDGTHPLVGDLIKSQTDVQKQTSLQTPHVVTDPSINKVDPGNEIMILKECKKTDNPSNLECFDDKQKERKNIPVLFDGPPNQRALDSKLSDYPIYSNNMQQKLSSQGQVNTNSTLKSIPPGHMYGEINQIPQEKNIVATDMSFKTLPQRNPPPSPNKPALHSNRDPPIFDNRLQNVKKLPEFAQHKTYLAPQHLPTDHRISNHRTYDFPHVKPEIPQQIVRKPSFQAVQRPQNNFKMSGPRGLLSHANAELYVNDKAYTVLSMLGRGGSSEVYQVLDPSTSKLLAVKCVDLSMVDRTIADGYLNEIDLLSRLQGCSSVIKMFDYEYAQEQKMLHVVMEKGDTDLSQLIRDISKTKKISMSMIIYYWTEMLTAVRDIHDQGIIHSDLKPANFLLVSGRLKLIDFGIASSQGDMTSVVKEVTTGTWNYMSPEAIRNTNSSGKGFKITYKSDVWSLGCILYNLVYGKTPFSHITNTWGKLQAIADPNHQIEFPEVGAPVVLAGALRSCFHRDPKQRPTVAELLSLQYHATCDSSHIGRQLLTILPQEWWLKVSHLFPDLKGSQGNKEANDKL